ncbi:MAG: cysteine desulfurase NifS [Acidobacteriota bacterium]
MIRQVYLDNNATTRLDPQVLEAMKPFYLEDFGNASSIHTLGQKARAAVEEARRQVADLIGAQPREIVFTSGGTESDNMAIRGVATHNRSRGNHIITSTVEHPAILRTCEQLEKEGFRVTYIPVQKDGVIRLDQLKDALDDQTILISIMHANNEVGTIQPIQEIAALAQERKIAFHTDAVQSTGKIPLDVEELGIDLLTLSGHKIHGPKGTGALYVRRGVRMNPLLFGGSHERHRRAGTENVPGIVGLGKACDVARHGLDDFGTRMRELRDRLENGILSRIPETYVNGNREQRMPHVTNISFRYLEGEALLISLDFSGIAVSTGAACSSGSLEPSHVLTAIGLSSVLAHGSIRFSLSRMTTEEDIDYVLETLPATVERMREMSPLYREG